VLQLAGQGVTLVLKAKAGLLKLVPKDLYLIRSNAYQWKEKEGILIWRKGYRQNEKLEDLPNR